jgi:hypothetical protein
MSAARAFLDAFGRIGLAIWTLYNARNRWLIGRLDTLPPFCVIEIARLSIFEFLY